MVDFKIYEDYLTLRSIHAPAKGTDVHVFRKFHATIQEARLDPPKMFLEHIKVLLRLEQIEDYMVSLTNDV